MKTSVYFLGPPGPVMKGRRVVTQDRGPLAMQNRGGPANLKNQRGISENIQRGHYPKGGEVNELEGSGLPRHKTFARRHGLN